MPPVLTVAILVSLLVHIPPLTASEQAITAPAQTVVVAALMEPASGAGLTVSGKEVVKAPQVLDTV